MTKHSLSLTLVLLGTSIAAADPAPDCKTAYVAACEVVEREVNNFCSSSNDRIERSRPLEPTAFITNANLQSKVAASVVAFDRAWSRCYGKVPERDCTARAGWVNLCGAEKHDKFAASWTTEMTWLKTDYLPSSAGKLDNEKAIAELEAFVKQAQEWNRAMPETMRFKDESMFADTLTKTAAAKVAVEEKAAKQKAEAAATAKARKLPKPAMRDAKLEKAMADVIHAKWSEEVLRVVITDKAWTKHVNGLGVLTDRKIEAVVAVKQEAGCRAVTVKFIQESPDARTFSPTQFYSVGDSDAIACENVK